MLLIPTNRPLVPRYGNYGGPGHSGEDENGIPYSLAPIDKFDELFKQHDLGYDAADKSGNQFVYIVADLVLLKRMKEFDSDLLDAEGKAYMAAAIELFEGKIWVHGSIAVANLLTNWYTDTKTRIPDPNSNSYRIVWIGGDPLALDLDGDRIETVAANGYSGALFDHNNDGIKTATGWINSDDGLLVRDINGDGIINNGSELFGDSTQLANGQTATQGFAALADLDSNADGKIDTSDTAFNELKIWRDLNQDGTSQEGELFTLTDLGIESLNTANTADNTVVPGGTQILAGSFTRTDGTTSTIADLTFRQDTFYSEYIDHIEIPEELQNLPNIQGMGRLRDLREAAALSPALAEVLGQYAAAETRTEQNALIDQLLLEWAKTDPQYSDALIRSINTIRLMTYDVASSNVIYLRVGQAVPNTVYDGKPLPVTYVDSGTQARTRVMDAVRGDRITNSLNEVFSSESANITRIYTSFAEAIYAEMLIQTRFEKYLNQVELSITETSISLDTSKVAQMFEERIATDPLNGITDLIEFNKYSSNILTGTEWDGMAMMEEIIRITPLTSDLTTRYRDLDVSLNAGTGGNENDNIILGDSTNRGIYGNKGNDQLREASADGYELCFGRRAA